MIIRFAAQNFKSLRERSEISFVASRLSDSANALIEVAGLPEKILPALAVYGANASGKSNLLAALDYMQQIVRWSHRAAGEGGGTNRTPFRLDSESRKQPSSFDIDFVVNGVRYHYGFTCNNKVILSEWLYAFPKRKRQIWFFRDHQNFDFGSNLTGRNRVIEEQVGEATLFLSAAAANKHDQLTPIFRFFLQDMHIQGSSQPIDIASVLQDTRHEHLIVRLLSSADFGIKSTKVIEERLSDKKKAFSKDLTDVLKRYIGDFEADGFDLSVPNKKVMLGHYAFDGNVVFMEDKDESSGTLKMLQLLGPIIRCLEQGSLLVIDEIDSSLHSAVSTALIKLFSSKKVNKHNAQLLFSTHDTNLLCSGGLRRDQIWFAEKSKDGATVTYPLTDIVTRKGDNLERGYLQGRYGAIPFIGAWEAFFSIDEHLNTDAETSVA